MNNQPVFTETQRFRQWWLWALLIFITGMGAYGIVKQIIFGIPFGDKPMSDTGLIITMLFMMAVFVGFAQMRLITRIDGTGVHYRFFPFHFSERTIAWSEIEKAYIRIYKPLPEYGGWGIRFGLGKNGSAFSTSGNVGLQLVLKDGRRILIGTLKKEEVEKELDKYVIL